MANRHLSRSIVLQSLFEWDFRQLSIDAVEEVLLRNTEEFAPGMGDFSFMKTLMGNVLAKREDIDNIIQKAAPEWPIAKIGIVDRNVLRIGLYELLFSDKGEVPAKVAINEAIELAKSFGGDTSGKFVNGVLGAVYKEMGEPGKDDSSESKSYKFKTIPYEKMPIDKLGGAVVYAKHEGQILLALVHDVFGHWTLSKGKLYEGATTLDAEGNLDEKVETVRKIKEEIGLDIKLKEELARNEYIATHPERGKVRKQVIYFLAEAPYKELELEKTGGLDKAEWFPLSEIVNLNFYNDILPIVTKAIQILLKEEK
ncbi:MAG: transcription antitermination factor NusB [Candidatus Paceibacterota bacterium]|jgi:N utilization substance protein B